MPDYELRLYKRTSGTKQMSVLIDTIKINAANDQEAIDKSLVTEIPSYDNSDVAILFDQSMTRVWHLDADR